MTQAPVPGFASTSELQDFIDVLERNVDHIDNRTVRTAIHTLNTRLDTDGAGATRSTTKPVILEAAAVIDGKSVRLTRTIGNADNAIGIELTNVRSRIVLRDLLRETDRLGLELIGCTLEELHAGAEAVAA